VKKNVAVAHKKRTLGSLSYTLKNTASKLSLQRFASDLRSAFMAADDPQICDKTRRQSESVGRTRLAILALVAICLAPMLRFGWVYDDDWVIIRNGFLREFSWSALWMPSDHPFAIPDLFRPTSVVFDFVSYSIFGLNPLWHHAISVALHLANTWLLGYFAALAGQHPSARLATILCFGVMAVHAEAIAVVSFREDLLATFFAILACIAATHATHALARTSQASCLIFAFLASFLAYGAKESAAPISLIWILLVCIDPWHRRLAWRAATLPALALGCGTALGLLQNLLVVGTLDIYAHAAQSRVFAVRLDPTSALLRAIQIQFQSWQQMLVPIGLAPEYVERGATWLQWQTWLALVGSIAALVSALLWRKRVAIYSFTVLATWAWLLPTSNFFVPLANMQADRYLYAPSAIVAIGLGSGLAYLSRIAFPKWSNVQSTLVMGLAFALIQGPKLVGQSRVYTSDATLWSVAVAAAPKSARAQAAFGLVEISQHHERLVEDPAGKLAAEIQIRCRDAATLDPNLDLPELCLARLAIIREDWEAANECLERALAKNPDRQAGTFAMLAQIQLDRRHLDPKSRDERARHWLDEGLRRYPLSAEVHYTAALVAHGQGQRDIALKHIDRALVLHPEHWQSARLAISMRIDLGDLHTAELLWNRWKERLEAVDRPKYEALARRLSLARRVSIAALSASAPRQEKSAKSEQRSGFPESAPTR
jgi:tetratricopeptide (TPR) repeat protein